MCKNGHAPSTTEWALGVQGGAECPIAGMLKCRKCDPGYSLEDGVCFLDSADSAKYIKVGFEKAFSSDKQYDEYNNKDFEQNQLVDGVSLDGVTDFTCDTLDHCKQRCTDMSTLCDGFRVDKDKIETGPYNLYLASLDTGTKHVQNKNSKLWIKTAKPAVVDFGGKQFSTDSTVALYISHIFFQRLFGYQMGYLDIRRAETGGGDHGVIKEVKLESDDGDSCNSELDTHNCDYTDIVIDGVTSYSTELKKPYFEITMRGKLAFDAIQWAGGGENVPRSIKVETKRDDSSDWIIAIDSNVYSGELFVETSWTESQIVQSVAYSDVLFTRQYQLGRFITPCTCNDGDAVPAGHALCGFGGDNKCVSCAEGHQLTASHQCAGVGIKCECPNGTPPDGLLCYDNACDQGWKTILTPTGRVCKQCLESEIEQCGQDQGRYQCVACNADQGYCGPIMGGFDCGKLGQPECTTGVACVKSSKERCTEIIEEAKNLVVKNLGPKSAEAEAEAFSKSVVDLLENLQGAGAELVAAITQASQDFINAVANNPAKIGQAAERFTSMINVQISEASKSVQDALQTIRFSQQTERLIREQSTNSRGSMVPVANQIAEELVTVATHDPDAVPDTDASEGVDELSNIAGKIFGLPGHIAGKLSNAREQYQATKEGVETAK